MKTFTEMLNAEAALIEAAAMPIDQVEKKRGSKPATLIIGRFQPPTRGHLKMAERAIAANPNATLFIAQVKSSANPVYFDSVLQEQVWKKMLGNHKFRLIELGNGFIGDAIHELRTKGFEPTVLAVGADRAKGFEGQINKYKDRLDADIRVIVVSRDDDNISGTAVRKSLEDNDKETFNRMMHSSVHGMFDELRKRMK